MLDFQTNNYNFPVEEQPVYTKDMKLIPDHKCIVRTDTGATLGMHGSRYKMIPHDDVVNSIIDGVKASNLTTDYTVSVDVMEDGRKLRGEIIFPDLVQEPAVDDYVQFRVSFFNSYDGAWPFSQQANGLRLWCLNGCTTADAIAKSRFKHTASVNVEGSASKIIGGAEHFMGRSKEWQSWMQTRLNDDQVEQFFRSTICKVVTKQKQVEKTNEKQLENLISGWQNERSALGANKWALYNCLTHWATHTNELRSPQVSRYNREAAISSAMNHNLFKSMTGFNVI
tara:strand:+ start:626 stop:1474 length:849 start_codon:yes stop_codon:yes gene_type:complete